MALTLSLLRESEIYLNGEIIENLSTEKAQGLLFYLVVESDRAHRREFLAEMLWPEKPPGYGRNNLKQTLSQLRSALGDRKAQNPFIITSNRDLQFNTSSDYQVDALEFEELVEKVQHHCQQPQTLCPDCAEQLLGAVDLYQDDFLSDFYLADSPEFNEWVLAKRESYKRSMADNLAKLIHCYERKKKPRQAISFAEMLVRLKPWSEGNHRILMRLLAASGKRSAALKQYHACQAMLASEFGVEPTPATKLLYKEIKEWRKDSGTLPPTDLSFLTVPQDDATVNKPPAGLKKWIILTASLCFLILAGMSYILFRPNQQILEELANEPVNSAGTTQELPQGAPSGRNSASSQPGAMPAEDVCLPGEKLLYLEDFQDGHAQGWPEIEYRAQNWDIVSDPETPENLVVQNPGYFDSGSYLEDKYFVDAVWRVNYLIIGKPEYIFIWHHTGEPYESEAGTVHSSDYSFAFMYDGTYFFRATHPFPQVELLGIPLSVEKDLWHTIEISTFRGLVEVWLDGQQLLSYQDPDPLPGGQMGLGLWTSRSDDSMIYFDNLRVCELTAPFSAGQAHE